MPPPNFMNRKKEWGDDDDEEEYETPVDDKTGIKQKVRTTVNNKGQKVRTTTTVRVFEKKIRIPKRVLARRNLPKFGDALEGNVNVTIVSRELVSIEHPDDQLDGDDDPNLGGALSSFVLKQQERALEREHDIEGLLNSENFDEEAFRSKLGQNKSDVAKEDDSKPTAGGKYVPPSARGGVSSSDARSGRSAGGSGLENAFKNTSDRDHENTLRVSNLTKAVTEEDLKALFGRFGRIHRVSLPRIEVKEGGRIVKEPRGFAYVAFVNHEDAEKAMERLQGHGYDHLILKLEWAKPPSKENAGTSGGLSGGYVSGYGTKLAQDTTEQVSYASNLTANR